MSWFWGLVLRMNTGVEQAEVFDAAGPVEGVRLLEVGHGPGVLLDRFAAAGATVTGVDPSAPMVEMTRRRLAGTGRHPRIQVGTAERTGLPDASFDLVVSVNNVPMWSDLAAGCAELRRVLVPGGRLLIAWHGGHRPARFARKLVLPEETLERVLSAVREAFGNGERETLDNMELFRALKE